MRLTPRIGRPLFPWARRRAMADPGRPASIGPLFTGQPDRDQGNQAQGRFDVIFCRNVLIYFDDESRRVAAENLYDNLLPGGFICLGHTESMSRISPLFEVCRYRARLFTEDRRSCARERQFHKKVLVVDDAALVRAYYRAALEARGFVGRRSAERSGGLEKLLLQPFDLVIVDINMPQMDGITFRPDLAIERAPAVRRSRPGHQHGSWQYRTWPRHDAPAPTITLLSRSSRKHWRNMRPSFAERRDERVRRTVSP